MRSDEGRGLGDALEEADCHYVAWVLDSCSAHCESSPDDHHAGEEVAGLEVVEGEVGRYLADGVTMTVRTTLTFASSIEKMEGQYLPNGEHSIDLIILISYKFKLLFHPTDIRIRQITSIEIVGKIHQATECQDEEVCLN